MCENMVWKGARTWLIALHGVLTFGRASLKVTRLRFTHDNFVSRGIHVDFHFNRSNLALSRGLGVRGAAHQGQTEQRRANDAGRGATKQKGQSHGQHGRGFFGRGIRGGITRATVRGVAGFSSRNGHDTVVDVHNRFPFKTLENNLVTGTGVGNAVDVFRRR